jgi:4-diphosphocytidyl-2-C-methyl-D-erythritol kinase
VPLEPILLVHPGLHVSTPSVYRALQNVGYPFPEALPSQAEGAVPPWRNDLTGTALWVCPPLAEVRDALRDSGGEPLLCGSGSCWAARYPTAADRDAAADTLQSSPARWSIWRV